MGVGATRRETEAGSQYEIQQKMSFSKNRFRMW